MNLFSFDYQPIIITLQLAAVTVVVLMTVGIPISCLKISSVGEVNIDGEMAC